MSGPYSRQALRAHHLEAALMPRSTDVGDAATAQRLGVMRADWLEAAKERAARAWDVAMTAREGS